MNLTICLSALIETQEQLVLSALNIPLSITAFLANLLIIVALQKPSSLHPPSKLLLGCLASTDLCVGLIIQPLFVTYLMSSENSKLCYYAQLFLSTTSAIFCGVSVVTLTAISVDRLLAVMLGLRYRQVVTLRRVWVLVVCFWFYHISISAISFFNDFIFVTFTCIEGILCIIISTCCYFKIYLTLRSHQAQVQVQDRVHQRQLNAGWFGINITRYKKTVSNALWVQTVFLVSYVPFGFAVAVLVITRLLTPGLYLALDVTFSLILLNASLNPFLYCWKMREVRQAVKETIRGFRCSS